MTPDAEKRIRGKKTVYFVFMGANMKTINNDMQRTKTDRQSRP